MRINVRGELRQPVGGVTSVDIEDVNLSIDGMNIGDVRGAVSLLRTDRGLLATLAVTGLTNEQCSRCLAPVLTQIEIRFEEEYIPLFDPGTKAPVTLEGSQDTFRIGADFTLDLSDGMRQYVLMSGSSKPLCSQICAGLCANCGVDLNSRECSCEAGVDSRWLPLSAVASTQTEGR
jgi:uncharacterized protein